MNKWKVSHLLERRENKLEQTSAASKRCDDDDKPAIAYVYHGDR